jgi:hypothetical protein
VSATSAKSGNGPGNCQVDITGAEELAVVVALICTCDALVPFSVTDEEAGVHVMVAGSPEQLTETA